MKKQDEVEDSLEFCKEIKYYEEKDHPLAFNKENYPRLKEYIHWREMAESKASDMAKNVSVQSEEPVMEEKAEESSPLSNQMPESELEEPHKDSKKRILIQNILQVIGCILVAFLLVYSVTTYLVTYTRVHGESMENTLQDKDVVVINRLAYRIHDPEQFDAIVFRHTSNVNLVKRIIALPGDTIQITNGTIYINGEVVNENYGKEIIQNAGEAENPITLGEDEYFVMGDNRNNSTDSRSTYVGLVKRQDIIGKVVYRVYPFSQIGTIR